jgi:hypothetical protein
MGPAKAAHDVHGCVGGLFSCPHRPVCSGIEGINPLQHPAHTPVSSPRPIEPMVAQLSEEDDPIRSMTAICRTDGPPANARVGPVARDGL